MSKPFRGMSQPQMTHLRPDIVLIEHSEPGAEDVHLSTNTYALLNAGRMLLVDTNVSLLLPFVRQLYDWRALLLMKSLANSVLRHYYFLVKQLALSCCIQLTTVVFFLLAIQLLALQLTRQKLVWNI